MADITKRVCAALLVVAVTAACDTKAQFAPSLPPEAGFRVDGGVLKLWTGTPCEGVTGLRLTFDSGTQDSTEQVWAAPRPGVRVERLDLLGGSSSDAGGLQVRTPLPSAYDWTKAGSVSIAVDGPKAFGAKADVAQVLRESAGHPTGSYLFGRSGWMDAAAVQRENRKSFLTVCTPDPA
ncbi:Conserved putative secreted protein [Amycolatopsis japonica]|uniref:Conserved putative secreted protein n=1 Tax=Amycolatopsis japonica TaxID=208439 RepID=A0A075V1Y5_9PSEU|nr:hypothetical protein [Amycolatopsis japonica]AIG76665.1 Conserved putative secreted protein [Amycolatopsis japonica]